MQIQINTDNTIDADDDRIKAIRDTVEDAMDRFSDRLTRVEVHIRDENAEKGGRDTRCGIEARARGLRPVQVDALEHTVDKAVREASRKLVRALDTQFGKLGR
ncbi:MAG: hypothetical protein EA351_04030 [Gemmatimonadales bacterium]|nr:MAG: hypothetical protein EA351_04030 [Gemmatimonadales bacterium]